MTELTGNKVSLTARDLLGDLCDRGRSTRGDKRYTNSQYRDHLGAEAWGRLPLAVRRRFSRAMRPGEAIVYKGEVLISELNFAGRLLANAARIAGAPLPLANGETGPAAVVVTDAPALGGQVWTRVYATATTFPQVIRSMKKFAGPTGLEEHLGYGLVMRLVLLEEGGVMLFRSAGYDVELFGFRLALPQWLSPGAAEIAHRDEGAGRFTFTLTLTHPTFGRMVHQVARFEEA